MPDRRKIPGRNSGGSSCSFSCFPPGRRFNGDQGSTADAHHHRTPPLSPHLEEQVLRDPMRRAEFSDRHCERRSANRRLHRAHPLGCDRIGTRRLRLALGSTSRRRRLTARTARHRCRLPQTGWRTIRPVLIFSKGRSGETGKLLVDQKSDQLSNFAFVRTILQLLINPLS